MYCTNCSEVLSNEMNFCPKCAHPTNSESNSNNATEFNQSNNVQLRDIKNSKNVKIEQNIFAPNKQEADIYYKVIKEYGSLSRIRRNTMVSMIPSGAGFLYYLLESLKPLLDLGSIFDQSATNSNSSSIMILIMLILGFQLFFLFYLNDLKRSDFVSLFRNSIFQVDLYLINDTIMKIKIESVCPKCQSDLYPYTKIEKDDNKKIISEEALLICKKNRNHTFEFDHTKLKEK